MNLGLRKHSLKLFVGDVVALFLALYLALTLRGLSWPEVGELYLHLWPFVIIFAAWIITFYIAGLYDRHTGLFRASLPSILTKAQLVNSLVAALVFYLIPYFLITPKTVLFLVLLFSLVFLIVWRVYISSKLSSSRSREKALIIGASNPAREVAEALRDDESHGLDVSMYVGGDDDSEAVTSHIKREGITVVVVDLRNREADALTSELYSLLFSGVTFIDLEELYEEIFGRVSLELIDDRWFLENISLKPKPAYELAKRLMDIIASIPIFVVSLILYPFFILAQQIENKGPVVYVATRVGLNNKEFPFYKFRTMTGVDYDKPDLRTKHDVTKVGSLMRKLRVDEMPQLWSLIKGDLSFIGPRPEFPALVEHYASQVPFYRVRHVVKPGASGWALVNDSNVPRGDADVDLTKAKLSYDLYYIKYRSFALDVKIALKTIKTLLSRVGV